MSLEFCILASGSSGNCSVLRTPGGVVLIDAGIGPRTAGRRMCGTGVTVADISAICLTHLDGDHFRASWISTIIKQNIRVFCFQRRVHELRSRAEGELRDEFVTRIEPFNNESFEALPALYFQPISLAHDESGSHGFVIEGCGCRLGYATDLGQVPAELIELFEDLDLLALESNYDPQMQLASSRPWFLKQRIMGGAGHLSNQQAFTAIRRILDAAQRRRRKLPAHIVLLHRSRQCNCPKLVRELFGQDRRIHARLTLAEQYQPSGWLRARQSASLIGEQLALAWT